MPFPKRSARSPDRVEMDRVLDLPVKSWPDAEDVEIESFDRLLAEAFEQGDRLFPTQVAAIRSFEETGGGLFPIGVGFGKTGICLMIAQSAFSRGVRKILWLLPPKLVGALVRRHIPEWRKRIPMSLNFHVLAGRSAQIRQRIAKSDAPGVYIFPYSFLSTDDRVELLEAIDAELVIADEVHNLKNYGGSAKVRSFMQFLEDRGPAFVGMSGTITSKGISDYQHLLTAALGEGSPLPLTRSIAYRWGKVLDVGRGEYPSAADRAMLRPMLGWANDNFPEKAEEFVDRVDGYRKAYQKRFTSAPGVVATDDMIGVSLLIGNVSPPPPGPEVLELSSKVNDGITPLGEPIAHAIHGFRWQSELACGFYNSLVWPTPAEVAKSKDLEDDVAEERVYRSKLHHGEHVILDRLLREFFKDARPGIDTPRDVGRSMSLYGDKHVPGELYQQWDVVRRLDFPERVKRKKIPVRVDDFKVRGAVAWAKERGRGILWVSNVEVGLWLTEELTLAGVDHEYCPEGAEALIESIGDPVQGGKGDRVVVASVLSHGVGRNLQAFQDQLFVQWPRSAILAEQAIGRTHRSGQMADELLVETLFVESKTMAFDQINRAATLCDAVYIMQTTGAKQRVVIADYEPPPEVWGPEFLREHGARPKRLDEDQKKVYRERFQGGS